VLGIGCGLRDPRLGRGSEFAGGFRWAAGDASRLIRNAHYFKLMGQPELALKELEEAHRLDPGNLQVADTLAQYYDDLGMGARAQQTYRETLALVPDNPVLQNNLCFSYYQAGDYNQAETCYRQTLARQPNNQAARNNLGLVLCRLGRQAEARQLWQEAEGEAVAAQKLGEALAALGMAGEVRYAQPTRTNSGEQPYGDHSPPGGRLAADPAAATAGPPPPPAPSPAAKGGMILPTPAPPAGPPAVKLAAAPAPLHIAPASPSTTVSRETPLQKLPKNPGPQEDRVSPSPPAPPRGIAAPASLNRAAPQPALAGQLDPQGAPGKSTPMQPRAIPRSPLTARELMETNIAIRNGNGIHYLAHEVRSQLSQEGFNVVDINNFRDFEVERTVIYYRPDAERVATTLNNKFFPRAELKPEPLLADSIDIKVILGRDLGPQQHAEAPLAAAPKRL
jgi:hypothetical protein